MRPIDSTLAWHSPEPPEQVWAALTDTAAYGGWWPWLERLQGATPAAGGRLDATIRAPARYRIRCVVRFVEVDEPHRLEAGIEGDVSGWALIRLLPDGAGTRLTFRWSLRPRRPLLRALGVVVAPVLVRGHDRIMDEGARQFVAGSGVDLTPVGTAGPTPTTTTAARPTGPDVARVALVAGAFSGVPSTVHALATGRDPLAATRAAGALLGRPTVTRGVAAHIALSLGWVVVLAAILPRRNTVVTGAVAGAAIAALDLGLVGRRLPAIRALPTAPQVADHIAFGALAAATLDRRARRAR
jgi:uncharacterized protein YndB with AHSA1/START domain